MRNWQVKYHPRLRDVRLHDFVLGVIEKTDRMDVARVASIKELRFESPLEVVAGTGEGTLRRDDELIQERLIRAIGKEVPEILAMGRAVGISGDSAFHPAGQFERRRRSDSILRGNFTGKKKKSEKKQAETRPSRPAAAPPETRDSRRCSERGMEKESRFCHSIKIQMHAFPGALKNALVIKLRSL